MPKLKRDSRQLYHMGVNYVFSPAPNLARAKYIEFQKNVLDSGLVFSGTKFVENRDITLTGDAEAPNLQTRVTLPAGAPIGQFLFVESKPQSTLDLFIKKAEAACTAFKRTWTGPLQFVAKDACIRHLYPCGDVDHAFKFLWEKKLRQDDESIAALKRLVLGGGLRLVLSPPETPKGSPWVELFIESFLENPKLLFVDVQFKWQEPLPPGSDFDPAKVLRELNRYATSEVLEFIDPDSDS